MYKVSHSKEFIRLICETPLTVQRENLWPLYGKPPVKMETLGTDDARLHEQVLRQYKV